MFNLSIFRERKMVFRCIIFLWLDYGKVRNRNVIERKRKRNVYNSARRADVARCQDGKWRGKEGPGGA